MFLRGKKAWGAPRRGPPRFGCPCRRTALIILRRLIYHLPVGRRLLAACVSPGERPGCVSRRRCRSAPRPFFACHAGAPGTPRRFPPSRGAPAYLVRTADRFPRIGAAPIAGGAPTQPIGVAATGCGRPTTCHEGVCAAARGWPERLRQAYQVRHRTHAQPDEACKLLENYSNGGGAGRTHMMEYFGPRDHVAESARDLRADKKVHGRHREMITKFVRLAQAQKADRPTPLERDCWSRAALPSDAYQRAADLRHPELNVLRAITRAI